MLSTRIECIVQLAEAACTIDAAMDEATEAVAFFETRNRNIEIRANGYWMSTIADACDSTGNRTHHATIRDTIREMIEDLGDEELKLEELELGGAETELLEEIIENMQAE